MKISVKSIPVEPILFGAMLVVSMIVVYLGVVLAFCF